MPSTISGQREWTLKVYDNTRDPGLEGDVQDVFFTSMAAMPCGKLRIVDESRRSWRVDVITRTVTTEAAPDDKTGHDDLLTPD